MTRFSVDSSVTSDTWNHGAALSLWDHQYGRVRPGRFSGRVQTAWLGPIQLIHEQIDHAFNYRGTSWCGSRIFFSYLPGCGEVFYDNRLVESSVLVTHRWDSVERVNGSGPINLVIAAIDEDFLRSYLARLPGFEEVLRTSNPMCYSSASQAIAVFQRTACGVLHELMDSQTAFSTERLRTGLQQRLLDAIIMVLADSADSRCRLPAPSTRAYVVGRAVDFMEAHLSDAISIRDICAAIRVCPRTLSYAFSEVLGTSPKSYLMAARLNRAFRDLADSRNGGSVESIAVRWGFAHMGRFANYYRAAFGERPSDTHRLRATRTTTFARLRAASAWPVQ